MPVRLRNILNILIFLSIVIAISLYLKYSVYYCDDFFRAFFMPPYNNENPFLFNLMTSDQGRVVISFIERFLRGTVSSVFHFHPQNNFLVAIVKGVVIASVSYLFAKLTAITKEKEKPNPIAFLFSFAFLMILIQVSMRDILNDTIHFVYICNFLFAFLGIFTLARYFLKDKIPKTKSELILNTSIAFLTGLAGHTIFIPLGCVFLFIILYSFLEHKNSINKNIIWQISLPLAFFTIGVILNVSFEDFQFYLDKRTSNNLDFIMIVENVKPFMLALFNNFVLRVYQAWLFWGVFILSFILILKAFQGKFKLENKSDLKTLYFALSIIFGIFVFNFLLITLDKETFYIKGQYWIEHHELRQTTSLYFFSAFMILTGRIIEGKKWANIIVAVLLCFCIYTLFNLKDVFIFEYQDSIRLRRDMYITEKAYIYYTLKNKEKIYLYDVYNITDDWSLTYFIQNMHLVHKFPNQTGLNFYDSCKKQEDKIVLIKENEDFWKHSGADGLIFEEGELDELNFTKLLNHDFILNK